MERTEFSRLVRDALNHLNDLAFLETSPLTGLLAGPGERTDGTALRRWLTDALQQLRPTQGGATLETAWRRYRCLYLRHVEGIEVERVQRELRVSGRQMRRDHLAGVEAVATLLWSSYLRLQRQGQSRQPLAGPEPRVETGLAAETEPAPPAPAAGLLEMELAKLGSSPPEGPLNVEQIVLGVMDTITQLAESRGVHIRLALPPQLPPVVVNRAVLRQVLLNLLSLAVEGDSGRRVELGGESGPRGVELKVTVRAGKPFAWPSEDDRVVVSERLIALQGGALQLKGMASDPLVARVLLPVAPTATVLVIDDNPDFARLFQRYLWAGGYRMLQASTGSQALRLAREVRPQAITLDVMMPSQDGWEILQELRRDETTRDIPVVVCSVLRERDLAFSLGAADFLAKPVTQQALLITLERCLSSTLPALERAERPPQAT